MQNSNKMHRRVSRVGLGEGVSLSANQSLRDKLENDIKSRPSVSKFASGAGSIRASPHGKSRQSIDQKSGGSAFSNRKSVNQV